MLVKKQTFSNKGRAAIVETITMPKKQFKYIRHPQQEFRSNFQNECQCKLYVDNLA